MTVDYADMRRTQREARAVTVDCDRKNGQMKRKGRQIGTVIKVLLTSRLRADHMDFYLKQLLTVHGLFRSYLYKVRK